MISNFLKGTLATRIAIILLFFNSSILIGVEICSKMEGGDLGRGEDGL